MRRHVLATMVLAGLAMLATTGYSDPPLPLHGVEGYGGVFSTYSAYLVNPGKEGEG